MKAKVICIEAYWNDDPLREHFERRCLVIPEGATLEQRQECLDEVNSRELLHMFEPDERIVGVHEDFTVFFYNPIYEIELAEETE